MLKEYDNPIYLYIHQKGVVHIDSSIDLPTQKHSKFFESDYYLINLNLGDRLFPNIELINADSESPEKITVSLNLSSAHLSIYESWDKEQGPIHLTMLFNNQHPQQRCKAHFYFNNTAKRGCPDCKIVDSKMFHEPVSDRSAKNYKKGTPMFWDNMPQEIKSYAEKIQEEINHHFQIQQQEIGSIYDDTNTCIANLVKKGASHCEQEEIEELSQRIKSIVKLSVNNQLRWDALNMQFRFKRSFPSMTTNKKENSTETIYSGLSMDSEDEERGQETPPNTVPVNSDDTDENNDPDYEVINTISPSEPTNDEKQLTLNPLLISGNTMSQSDDKVEANVEQTSCSTKRRKTKKRNKKKK